MLLLVSGDVMASSAILQNHAGTKSRSKFHGEKEGESSRVLQVLSAEGSLCVRRIYIYHSELLKSLHICLMSH